jgi:serine/threonine-protein kinase RsbW
MLKALFYRELTISSTIEGLDECMAVLNEIDKRFNFSFNESFGLHTVLIESLENAFIHGNKGNKELEVRILISINEQEIFMKVEDCGEGYDFNSVSYPTDGSAVHNESGRGIFFIKSLSSSCYTIGKGNIICIKIQR